MHSSPIDLLARPPAQPKTQPSDSDSDQRFSELLRQPADDASAPSPTGQGEPAAAPAQEQHAPSDPAEAAQSTVTEGGGVAEAKDGLGQGPETIIEALAIIPDAITHGAQTATPHSPQVPITIPVAGSSADGLPTPTPIGPSAGAPADGLIPRTPPPAGAIQPGADASAQTGGPATTPNTPVVAAPAAPSQPIAPGATHPLPDGSDAAAHAKLAMTAPTETAIEAPGTAVKPAAIAGASATPASANTLTAEGAASTVASTGLAASTRPATSPRIVTDTSVQVPVTETAESPEPELDIDLPAVLVNKTASQKASGSPVAGQSAGVTATPAGSNPSTSTTPEVARPEAAVSDRVQTTAQPDPVAAAPTPSARPIVETATLVQASNGNAPPAPAAEQVVLQLRKAVANGVDRMTVQLKPATLGRVDVQMEVGHDGRVQAVISAERPETLHLLQRDARTLTTALADAGLQADSGSLSFNLRGQTGDQAGGNDRLSSDGPNSLTDAGAEDGDDAIAPITLTLGEGRVDIKV